MSPTATNRIGRSPHRPLRPVRLGRGDAHRVLPPVSDDRGPSGQHVVVDRGIDVAVADLIDEVLRRDPAAAARADDERQVRLVRPFDALSYDDLVTASGFPAADEAIEAWRDGRLVVVLTDPELRFPGFQFGDDGRILPVVQEAVGVLRRSGTSGWDALEWFTSPNEDLSGARPADRTSADDDLVRAAVRRATIGSPDWDSRNARLAAHGGTIIDVRADHDLASVRSDRI